MYSLRLFIGTATRAVEKDALWLEANVVTWWPAVMAVGGARPSKAAPTMLDDQEVFVCAHSLGAR